MEFTKKELFTGAGATSCGPSCVCVCGRDISDIYWDPLAQIHSPSPDSCHGYIKAQPANFDQLLTVIERDRGRERERPMP